MKGMKLLASLLALSLALCACATQEGAVFVQSVADLADKGGIAPGDRFAGLVVSENVSEVFRDSDKVIGELLVREGDDVSQGQALFSYDTDQLQLNLDKQRLELEQMKTTIENYKTQLVELEKEREKAPARDKLQYTIQIQTMQVDLAEAELNLTNKEKQVTQSETVLENAVVYAPVTGRIQSINDGTSDNYGFGGNSSGAYITIQQAGSYRIKGTIGELQRGGIMEATRMKVVSRTDPDIFWLGTVSLVDYENPSQGSNNDMYFGGSADEMTASSKYPFYVELDSTDNLILGQHVYLEVDVGEEEQTGLYISSAFLCYDEDGSSYVWAEKDGRLEKRAVEIGEYNFMMDTMEIRSGLSEEDYIAFPDMEFCVVGAPTTHEYVEREEEGEVG